MTWWTAVQTRVVPLETPVALPGAVVVVALAVALGLALSPAWPALRLAVTLVHELAHAGVGVLGGRRFTGFVVGGDGSGHAVTMGRARGPGLVATTWAGYPAPAVVGAALLWVAGSGWAPTVLGVMLLLLLASLVRVRSGLTALVMLVALASVGALWWAGSPTTQSAVLLGVGLLLLVGAWRHVAVVWASRSRSDDHRALAALTGVPSALWVLSWALVCTAATWVGARAVVALLSA